MDRKEPQVLMERIAQLPAYGELEKRIRAGHAQPIGLSEVDNAYLALIVATLRKRTRRPCAIILPTDTESQDFLSDLAFLGTGAELLPWWKTAAYRHFRGKSKCVCTIAPATTRAAMPWRWRPIWPGRRPTIGKQSRRCVRLTAA